MTDDIDLKDTWKKWDKWVRKNLFTLIGIIIILIVVIIDMVLVQDRIVQVVKKCNIHWRQEVKGKCPNILDNATWIVLDEIE